MNDKQIFSNYPDVLTVEQLQELLHIGRNKAYQLLNSGQLKSIRIGRKHIIPKKNVLLWLDSP